LFWLYLTFEFTLVSSLPLMTEILPGIRTTFMATYMASLSAGRMLGDLTAPALYGAGGTPGATRSILLIAVIAALIDLIGLSALRFLHLPHHDSLPVE
jgi:hypothetical protein